MRRGDTRVAFYFIHRKIINAHDMIHFLLLSQLVTEMLMGNPALYTSTKRKFPENPPEHRDEIYSPGGHSENNIIKPQKTVNSEPRKDVDAELVAKANDARANDSDLIKPNPTSQKAVIEERREVSNSQTDLSSSEVPMSDLFSRGKGDNVEQVSSEDAVSVDNNGKRKRSLSPKSAKRQIVAAKKGSSSLFSSKVLLKFLVSPLVNITC